MTPAAALTVIIPTHGRALSALETLQSVAAQQTRAAYEIVIAASEWDARLTQSAEAIGARHAVPVRCICLPHAGLHHGRHAGARAAASEHLAFLDDDVDVAPGWVEAVVTAFEDEAVCLVGGKSLPLYESAPPDWLEAFWTAAGGGRLCGYLSLIDLGDQARLVNPHLVWGLNFAIRREALLAVGGFHPDGLPWEQRRFRGDGETHVSREAARRGWKAMYRPDAAVRHRIPASRLMLDYFEKRAYLQGISDSYTAIRANGGINRRPGSGLRRLLSPRALKERLRRAAPPRAAQARFAEQRRRVQAAYRDGYSYHQDQVRSDPQLQTWVLRPDYWDADAVISQGQTAYGPG